METGNQTPTQHPISSTPSHSTYDQPHFPTSQIESNSAKSSNVPPKVANRKAPNWRHSEDMALCEAWLHISENPIVGTRQTDNTSFWFHIFEDFCKKKPGTKRTQKGLENRWNAIQADVTKWRAIVCRINRNHQSGTNAANEWGACYKAFKNDHNRDFKFYDCWEILQHSVKWHISASKKSKGRPFPRSDRLNVTPPPASPIHDATPPSASPIHDFTDIDVDGLHDDGVYPSTGIHVAEDSPSPVTPTGPTPCCIRSEPLEQSSGRKSVKEKRCRNDINALDEAEASVRNNMLIEWRISQNSQYEMMLETNKAQIEYMKASNELHAFHLVKKTKLEQLQCSIAIVQAIGDTEEKMIRRTPLLMTPEVQDRQNARFKKLQDLEREHDEIRRLEYSPGGSASN